MSIEGMRAANKLTNDIIERIRAEGAGLDGAATAMTALQYVVAQVLVTWHIPIEVFVARVNKTISKEDAPWPLQVATSLRPFSTAGWGR